MGGGLVSFMVPWFQGVPCSILIDPVSDHLKAELEACQLQLSEAGGGLLKVEHCYACAPWDSSFGFGGRHDLWGVAFMFTI